MFRKAHEEEFQEVKRIFWKGVIENNNDPLKDGRYQVRILGIHSPILADVPVSSLPWATTINSMLFRGFNSGFGETSIAIQGTWVWLFLDEDDIDKPVIVGAIGGSNGSSTLESFKDPSGTYPNNAGSDFTNPYRVGAKYLTNSVISTPGGHVIEIDDSSGDARINIHHKSGSNILFSDNGTITMTGTSTITMNAAGNITIHSGGNVSLTSSGTMNVQSTGACTIQGSSVTLKSSSNTMVI